MNWRRHFLNLLRVIVFSGLLLVCGLYLLIASETGTRWLLNTVFEQTEQLHVQEIQGNLLHELTLTNLQYQIDNESNLQIQRAYLRWQAIALFDFHFHVEQLRLDHVTLNGLPESTESSSDETALPVLPVQISLDDLQVTQLAWIQDDATEKLAELRLRGRIAGQQIQLHDFNLQHERIHIQGQANSTWNPQWPFQARLNWSLPDPDLPLQGILTLDGNIKGLTLNSHLSGAIQAHQAGQIDWSQPELDIRLQGDWQQLQWPLTGTAQMESRQGSFQLSGHPEAYQLNLQGQLAIPEQPVAELSLQATGSTDQIHLALLELKSKRSTLNLQGDIGWQPELNFALQTQSDAFYTDDFIRDIPGLFNLKARTEGKIEQNHLQVKLQVEQLQGHLFQQKIAADGQLDWNGQTLKLTSVRMSAGRNHLHAEGQWSDQHSQLNVQIKAPDLSTAWPTLKGQFHGAIRLQGSTSQPEIQAQLAGKNLQFSDYQIKTLRLNADYPNRKGKSDAQLAVWIEDAVLNEQPLHQLKLKGRGDLSNHHYSMQVKTPQLNLDLTGQGKWLNPNWQGTWNQFTITPVDYPPWQLQHSLKLNVQTLNDRVAVKVSESCLQQNTARFCFSVQNAPDQHLQGYAQLSKWSLAQLKPFLPEPVSLTGDLKVDLDWRYDHTKAALNLQLMSRIDDGMAIFHDEGHEHHLPFSHPALQLNMDDQHWKGHLNLGLNATDQLSVAFTADNEDANGERPLSGTLQIHLEDLTFIDGFIPAIHDLQGRLHSDLQLAGTLQNPRITGQFTGEKGRFFIPAAGIQIEAMQWRIQPEADNAERLNMTAQMQSGPGQMEIKGHFDLSSEQHFPLLLHLQGRDFQVSRLPEAEVTLSPELTVQKQGQLTTVKGKIEVAKAQIELQDLPDNITAPSEDEVIIDPSVKQTSSAKVPQNIVANVDLLFGEQTRFNGLGLKTRLSGQLKYSLDADRQSLQGRAVMQDASYQSYGQDLKIRRGEFLFNGPATNPWMNIEATRQSKKDNVTAILSVTGPLTSPTTRIYSEPELSESEALAYLITGNSLEKLGQSESAPLANAALNYGVGQLSWLSNQLGIDEFGFEQSDTLQNSSIRLGQYLNPDLYVGISMGLFENKYAASLNYRLSKNISVGTRAGETQRIDLNYHFSTD